MRVAHCNVERIRTLFDNFSKEVADRKFKKLDYKTWKEMRKVLDAFKFPIDKISVRYNPNDNYLTLESKENYNPGTFWLNIKDDSFGSYLFQHLVFKEGMEAFSEDSQIFSVDAFANVVAKDNEATCCENIENKKENKNMINFNFDFGRVESDRVRMSPYGLAVKNSNGTYVSYNAATGEITDVDTFNFDGSQFMYKVPVALKDVQSGDVIIHNHKPMFVSKVEAVNLLTVVDIYNGERKDVIPTTNMFGFNFVTKVVSLINMGTPTDDNPFGNILPFMLMADKGKGDNQDMLMAMMLMNQNADVSNNAMLQNPLMFMVLMDGENKDNDMFKMLMLSQMMTSQNVASFSGTIPVEHSTQVPAERIFPETVG